MRRLHQPTSIRLLGSGGYGRISVNLRAVHARTCGIGICNTAWINMRFVMFEHRAQYAVKVEQWIHFAHIIERNRLKFKTQIFCFGSLDSNLIVSFLRCRKINSAHRMDSAGLTGLFL